MDNFISILIADDHAMVKQGIKQLLELEPDFKVVATASNGDEAVRFTQEFSPNVVLMDINMPIKNGLMALEELKKINPAYKIIILTIHHDREYLFKTLNLGADGYVLKDAEPNILIEAIRTVVNGDSYIQPSMLKELVKEFKGSSYGEKSNHDSTLLTIREIEVLKLISQGLLNKNIAKTLFISEKTVKNHVSSIFRKLNVTDRTQAAIYALKNNVAEKW
jgi:two-component system, NarL family, response regulator DegU